MDKIQAKVCDLGISKNTKSMHINRINIYSNEGKTFEVVFDLMCHELVLKYLNTFSFTSI